MSVFVIEFGLEFGPELGFGLDFGLRLGFGLNFGVEFGFGLEFGLGFGGQARVIYLSVSVCSQYSKLVVGRCIWV